MFGGGYVWVVVVSMMSVKKSVIGCVFLNLDESVSLYMRSFYYVKHFALLLYKKCYMNQV